MRWATDSGLICEAVLLNLGAGAMIGWLIYEFRHKKRIFLYIALGLLAAFMFAWAAIIVMMLCFYPRNLRI